MSVHCLKTILHNQQVAINAIVLGESPMPYAPSVTLPNGQSHIPQHYLQYQHSAESIQRIVHDIDFSDNTPVFAGEDHQGLYIQVGLIGRENYDRLNSVRPQKLVYGRKWRINADTPTSEIIQTVFLAIKKAREHEVRELLTLKDQSTGKISTPLSNHHDLALMANNRELLLASTPTEAIDEDMNIETIRRYFQGIQFGQRPIYVTDIEQRRKGQFIVDFKLGISTLARQLEGDLSEYDEAEFSVIVTKKNPSAMLYALMDTLISDSDQYVEEHFTYQGYARFSRRNDPAQISVLSIASRPYARDIHNQAFNPIFKQTNYDTDASRVPSIGTGKLASKNSALIGRYHELLGHMPVGYFLHTHQGLASQA